ncbi:endopeptidase La [Helicobacter macacae]|uniref:Lon protease n=1 Tax=Helicobacter macacae MIT 99-5501 TaxID=1357400 RepID=V8C8D8_9HELI|nr:endopeptidase La [Helicobacter macacae]ETD23619.1 ATP-dependent protease La [Helicobacter macacae MIT 99-5501]
MQPSNIDFPMRLPVIVEEDNFSYPFSIVPIFTHDEKNIKAATKALDKNDLVFVCCAKEPNDMQQVAQNITKESSPKSSTEKSSLIATNLADKPTTMPKPDVIPSAIDTLEKIAKHQMPFFDVGVIGTIMRKVHLPDGRVKLLFQGLTKGRILSLQKGECYEALVDIISYKECSFAQVEAMSKVLREKVQNLANISQVLLPPDLLKSIEETGEPNRMIDLVASSIRLKKEQAYKLFRSDDIEERLLLLIDFVSEEIQIQKLQKEIKTRVHNKMEQTNKEYFLKEQLRQIQKELGIDKQRDEEIEQYEKKLESIKPYLNKEAYKEIKKQISRLSKMHQESGDANILQNYVEWVLEIPFGKYAKESLSIKNVQKQLDLDHYSLIKPKERIVEYFAVKDLLAQKAQAQSKERAKSESKITKKDSSLETSKNSSQDDSEAREEKDNTKEKGTILCFYGPPGVGKTSLANSIAKAVGRELVRIALGGLEDVNELRGHRRTYIGAMPGRITQGLIEAKQMNPVMVLDEIDKVARGVRGDPTSVLLEILDPEQNVAFRDYYNNFSIDLSQVIFIATANDIGAIPPPLRDRMEFISISSYTPQEKEQIALKYLIPQELKKHGLGSEEIEFGKEAIKTLIERYTREAGVRNLRRVIASIMRKVATKILTQPNYKKIRLTPKLIPDFIDKIVYEIDPASKAARVGIINGLAWTSVGGDVLKIEAIKLKGKGGLSLTGSLGDVMKESAKIAHSVVKVLLDENKLKPKNKKSTKAQSAKESKKESKDFSGDMPFYSKFDIHLHLPEGAVPKDGPSAGIAMACVIASILCDKAISGEIAMTGELTLSGDVLAIGGLKEKLIAAHKAGIKRALIPSKNYERDLNDIPKEVLDSLQIIPVKNIDEVFVQVFG